MILYFVKWVINNRQATRHVGALIVFAIALNLTCGTAFFLAERNAQAGLTWADSVWWSMVSMTTVGYCDFYAQTFIGRFFVSYPTFVFGIGFLGYILGSLAEQVIAFSARRRKGFNTIMDQEHIIICGFPNEDKVVQIIRELRATSVHTKRKIVIVTERIEELKETLSGRNIAFVKGTGLKKEILEKAGINDCYGLIILSDAPGNADEDAKVFSITNLVTHIEKEIGRDLCVVSELSSKQNRQLMAISGNDGTICHEGLTDCLIVQEFCNPGLAKVYEQLITNSEGCQIYLQPTKLEGVILRSVQKAAIEHDHDLQIIGVQRNGAPILNPPKELVLEKTDYLIMLADKPDYYAQIEKQLMTQSPTH